MVREKLKVTQKVTLSGVTFWIVIWEIMVQEMAHELFSGHSNAYIHNNDSISILAHCRDHNPND